MLPRPRALRRIRETFRVHPVAALLGPRQCGKTTLAREYARGRRSTYFDLENPVDARRLSAPMVVLESLTGLIVIDEVQRQPAVLEIIRVLADRPRNPARFLLLGSASLDVVRGASESLAGRIGFVDLAGFDIGEVPAMDHMRLWVRGGFPRSYLAPDDAASTRWRDDFIRTFLERDIPQLGINVPAETLRRFWTMTAHYHAQIWNASELARSLGGSESSARRYLDIMAGAFMLRVLPPWFENLGKRQVKAPKVYVRDSGVLHALLGLSSTDQVQGHPKLGASWEGFALEQLLVLLDTRDAYYWATHGGAELDLLVFSGGKRFGFEFKHTDAPSVTKSMRVATTDLDLDHLWVIYPGREPYPLDSGISAVPLANIGSVVAKVRKPGSSRRGR